MSDAIPETTTRLERWKTPTAGLSASGGDCASPLGQWAWAWFEGARNPHVLLITIYIFAPYFARFLVGDPVKGQALWADLNTYAGVIIALVAPFLGAIADAGGRRKPWLFAFSLSLGLTAAALWFALPNEQGQPFFTICVLLVATFASFDFTAVFHNAMLPTLVPEKRVGALSGLGLALGNLSGVLLLVFMMIVFALPGVVDWPFVPAKPWFGIDQAAHEPERLVGPLFALWFLVGGLPLFFLTPDQPRVVLGPARAVVRGVTSLVNTVAGLKNYRNVALYLVARMIYNDGCNAILIFGGIYASTTFSWGPLDMLVYGVILSVFATFGGVFGGWLDHAFGSQRSILIAVAGTAVGLVLTLTMQPDTILYFIHYDTAQAPVHGLPFFKSWPEIIYVILVIIIAIFITASYANSRTMLARIAPTSKMTEFFGLYALSGTATAFLAPFVVARATEWSQSQTIGLASVLILLAIGFTMMLFVKNERAVAVT
ncbi:MAG: MFS transporter [Alphaproteobacteria bacterium]|nr:MFS transporter [Alphaproteobacteria bacterium]